MRVDYGKNNFTRGFLWEATTQTANLNKNTQMLIEHIDGLVQDCSISAVLC